MNRACLGASAILAAALAGCGGPDPVAENAADAAALPEVEAQPPDPMTGAGDVEPANAVPPRAAGRAGAGIPRALRGRWALSPGDCVLSTPSPSVLIITADALQFHESVARPVSDVDSAADFISGQFAFVGEGESWTRFQSLQLRGADQLIRAQTSPPQSYTYVRCSG